MRWRTCPACRALVDASDSACAYCGSRLLAAQRAPLSVADQAEGAWRLFPVTAGFSIAMIAIYAGQLLAQKLVYGEPLVIRGLFSCFSPSFRVNVLFAGLPPGFGGAWYEELCSAILGNFVHSGGLLHLGFNLSAFALLGRRVEAVLGRGFALLLIFVGCFSLAIAPFLQTATHWGFSGVVCAFLGAVLVHARATRDYAVAAFAKHWTITLAIWSLMPMISWAGHLAGFLLGAGLTSIWMAPYARVLHLPLGRRIAGTLGSLALLACVALHLRDAVPAFRFREFHRLDALVVRIYQGLAAGFSDRAWADAARHDLEVLGPLPKPWSELESRLDRGLAQLASPDLERQERTRILGGLLEATEGWFEHRDEYVNRLTGPLSVSTPGA